MLEIPGYYFDLTSKKYFKIPANVSKLVQPKQISAQNSNNNVPKSKRRRVDESRKGKEREFEPSTLYLRAMHETHPTQSENSRRKHNIESIGMSRLKASSVNSPNCLQRDETITVLEFDNSDPSILRVGGSSGSVASGSMTRATNKDVFFPNDEFGWRTNYSFPSQITSIKTCSDRLLMTSFGSPAQALISSCSSVESSEERSVILSPPQTSLWSSALNRDLVVLGCDKKVLVSRDPSRSAMEVFATGGKGGGGAVFALELIENTIFAGTRRGEVKIFDLRSTRSVSKGAQATRTETSITSTSSVIHIRRIRQDILVAGMNGSIDLHDIRFSTKPYLTLGESNINSYTRDAGIAIWDDHFVASAGQDKKLRIYSLLNGNEIEPAPSLASPTISPFSRTFSDPIKALTFSPVNAQAQEDGSYTRIEVERMGHRYLRDREVKLWVAEGINLECFTIDGIL